MKVGIQIFYKKLRKEKSDSCLSTRRIFIARVCFPFSIEFSILQKEELLVTIRPSYLSPSPSLDFASIWFAASVPTVNSSMRLSIPLSLSLPTFIQFNIRHPLPIFSPFWGDQPSRWQLKIIGAWISLTCARPTASSSPSPARPRIWGRHLCKLGCWKREERPFFSCREHATLDVTASVGVSYRLLVYPFV